MAGEKKTYCLSEIMYGIKLADDNIGWNGNLVHNGWSWNIQLHLWFGQSLIDHLHLVFIDLNRTNLHIFALKVRFR